VAYLTNGKKLLIIRETCNIYIYFSAFGLISHKAALDRNCSALRQLRQIHRSVLPATFQSLVVTMLLSRLDYGNAVLIGLPTYLVRRLQSVLNAATRLIYHMRSADNTSPTLLPVFKGWAFQSGSSTKLFFTEIRCDTLVHSFLLLICLNVGNCAPLAPIANWCHLSDSQLSVTGLSRLSTSCLEHFGGGHNNI